MKSRIITLILAFAFATIGIAGAAIYAPGYFSNITVTGSGNAVTLQGGGILVFPSGGSITIGGTGSNLGAPIGGTNLSNTSSITATGLGTFTAITVSGTIKGSSNGATVSSPVIVYTSGGAIQTNTVHAANDTFTGTGSAVTTTFSGGSPFANTNYVLKVYDRTTGIEITPFVKSTGSFALSATTNADVYVYFAVGI